MTPFKEQAFSIPELKGMSKASIEEHLKLYSGYIKHANLILEKISELEKDPEKNSYAISEVQRRFGFEFNGMRNHEVYFKSLEHRASELAATSTLRTEIEKQWGSFDVWLQKFKSLALTRGIGWAMLYRDRATGNLIHAWIDEQHLGQLQDSALILALDMWEHSYVADYAPSGKKKYIEDFFTNLNWSIIEANFIAAQK